MGRLGCGLSDAEHHEDALSVREAQLSMLRRLGASEDHALVVQGNLANTYEDLGQMDKALSLQRDVCLGFLELHGDDDISTLRAALNYANSLNVLRRFKEARELYLKNIPVARRVLSEGHELTLKLRWSYAEALYYDKDATLDDLREAVTTLEELALTARRVLGPVHPSAAGIESSLRKSQVELQEKLLLSRVSLRFAVGARVECWIGTWAPGRVIKLHYHEASFEPGYFAPYQVELDDGGLIYAPEDDDECIRAAP